jgi:putative redox protein
MKTITYWKTGEAFESVFNNSRIEIDGKAGFSPKALLLSGLASCSGIDLVEILEKMRIIFADLKIEVESEQTEGPPKVFKDIHINYILTTEEQNRAKIKKAIDLSLEKYCGVSAMLGKHSKILFTITIQEGAG